ncbi:hypothetical protein CH251_12520 [Rhodococcus sp. 06-462-5]|uniref:CbtA family protein n=1 Tax=Nocardiaceae TaxID=85025 RepID=UPI00050BFD3E|nr:MULTISPECIES: CbtA family protein [Rhodococcus]OZC73948.1 hypothetical protein CH251_12520 [Rhodococcus sp. 06-462-5]OZE67944.1 hypothetical protein CH270_09480 [Rhodococcus sp. 02-925g]OZF52035.1 hypothetical protein CH291_05500 [Rhodococcus sp. 14-1411-2a]
MPLNTASSTTHSTLTGSLKQLLVRGILAGFVAGILAGGVAYITGEHHIDAAIAIEESHATTADDHNDTGAPAGHHHNDTPLVPRDGQRAGLFLATALSGAALGAIYACVLTAVRTRSGLSAAALIAAVGTAGWFSVAAVPFFEYPANPPAVGDPDTIDQRTILWFAMVLLGLLAIAAFVFVRHVVATRIASQVLPTVAAAVALIVVIVTGYALAPAIDEVPSDFPASLLWQFRISSLATQLTLWSALMAVFALLTERASRRAIS